MFENHRFLKDDGYEHRDAFHDGSCFVLLHPRTECDKHMLSAGFSKSPPCSSNPTDTLLTKQPTLPPSPLARYSGVSLYCGKQYKKFKPGKYVVPIDFTV